jgi:uncharacterized protein (TIGR00369 family)
MANVQAPIAAEALLERLRRIPIISALALELREIGAEQVTLYAPYRKEFSGIFDSFHGGLLMTLADTAACVAILARVEPDAVITTTDMNIRFLNACLTGAVAQARVIKLGKSLCPVAVDLFDENGVHVAVAQVTYMRLPKMPKR